MASNTPNLNLLKKDPIVDRNDTFNIQTMLNDNWDKIDAAMGDIDIPEASLDVKGKVQLSNALNSDAEDLAATPKAVKAAYDAGAAAQVTANQAFQAGNERKSELVAALVAKGVAATTSETWASLLSKVTALIKATGSATAAQVLSGATFSNAAVNNLTGTMPNRGAGGTVTPGTANQSKPAGYYSSPITVLGDADLVPGNVKSGVDIFGVLGTYSSLGTAASGTQLFITWGQSSDSINLTATPVKVGAVKVYLSGTYHVSFGLYCNNNNARAKIYVNSNPVSEEYVANPSTYVNVNQVIPANGGDTIEIWMYAVGANARGFYNVFRVGINPANCILGENIVL